MTNTELNRAPADPVAGYFGPDSMSWRLYREPFYLLGGVRALLLQVAHPAVADAVARFSNFREDALGRGYRTFEAMAAIYFGDQAQADRTGQRLQKVHRGMAGHYPETSQAIPLPYRADDAPLQWWVLATLIDTTLHVYAPAAQRLNLPPDWREQFYEESKRAAAVLGIPADVVPMDLAAFNDYFSAQLNSGLLGSTPVCGDMALAVIEHRLAPRRLARLMARGGLPTDLCDRLGVRPEKNVERRYARIAARMLWLHRLMPRALRASPAWHQAMARIRRAQGLRPGILGVFYDWLSRRRPVLMGIAPNAATTKSRNEKAQDGGPGST